MTGADLKRALCGLVIACALAACGSLQVQVDVLNPDYLDAVVTQPQLRNDLVRLATMSDADFKRPFDSAKAAFQAFYDQKAAVYQAMAAQLPAGPRQRRFANSARSLSVDAVKDSFALVDRYYATLQSIQQYVRGMFLSLDPAVQSDIALGRRRVPDTLVPALKAWHRQVLVFAAALSSETGKLPDDVARFSASISREPESRAEDVKAKIRDTAQQAAATADATNAALKSLTGGPANQLLSDQSAYGVASAPDYAWANRYNGALADGRFGNVDIAIKLESLGNFTVKGMSFDPSTVAQVASKMATQSVLLAAQMAGVPVSSANVQANQSGGALATSSAALATAQATADQRAAALQDYRAALLDIAAAITREKQEIKDDTARAAAIAAIRATFDNHKSRLSLSALQ